jgi:SpoVK/Ycf46/Vps4 family AAA+-type ATPase
VWKAVILLDEADVFLQARDESGKADSKRNAMVAIFLRELEYFSGIVFLTTNLLRSFDKAIRSRIHLALSFDPPTRNARALIWTQYLKKIPASDIDVPSIGEAVEALETRLLNGREILNALNMARTIARFQGNKLQLQHLEGVLEVRDAFDKRIRDEARALTNPGQSDVRAGMLLRQNSILSAEPDEYE